MHSLCNYNGFKLSYTSHTCTFELKITVFAHCDCFIICLIQVSAEVKLCNLCGFLSVGQMRSNHDHYICNTYQIHVHTFKDYRFIVYISMTLFILKV